MSVQDVFSTLLEQIVSNHYSSVYPHKQPKQIINNRSKVMVASNTAEFSTVIIPLRLGANKLPIRPIL
ncbi:MAG: hypothetical protein WCA39_10355 [Nitrososphaeraceae archaeon]